MATSLQIGLNLILAVLFATTILQIFNIIDTDLAPLFSLPGRIILFTFIVLLLAQTSSPTATTLFLIFFVPTALYAEHIKDRLIRKTAVKLETPN